MNPEFYSFTLSFFSLVVLLGFTALLGKVAFPKMPLALGVMGGYAATICFSSLADYIGYPFLAYVLFLLLFFGLLGKAWVRTRKLGAWNSLKKDLPEGLALYIAWLGAVFIIALPLFATYSKDTIITSYWVNNDSVAHAFLSRGFAYTRAHALAPQVAADVENYPRGIHSLVYVLDSLWNIPPVFSMLPIAILSASMIVFAVWPLLQSLPLYMRIIPSVAAASPFLTVSSVYFLFVPQVAASPLILCAVWTFLNLNFWKDMRWALPVATALACSAVLVYSVFSASLLAIAFVLRMSFYFFIRSSQHRPLWRSFHIRKRVKSFIPVVILFASLAPVFHTAIQLFAIHTGDHGNENFWNSTGIIPERLSLFHLTGAWKNHLDPRDGVSIQSIQWPLIFLFIFQLCVIARTITKKEFSILFCFIPLLVITSLFPGTYLHFKYLAIIGHLVAFFFVLGMMKRPGYVRYGGAALGVCYILLCSLGTIDSHHPAAVVDMKRWRTFQEVSNESIRKWSTLVLSKEDWFSYFIDDADDSAPLTQYLHQDVPNRRFQVVVFDKNAGSAIDEFFDKYPRLKAAVEKSTCRQNVEDRFTIVNLSCS